MVLSDRTIREEIERGRIVVDPFDPELVQPSSVDVRVDRSFRVFHNARYPYIDVRQPMDDLTEKVEVDGDDPFILHPGEFVLGQTLERVTLPDDLVARLEGKSSLGRLGLLIHSTARTRDPELAELDLRQAAIGPARAAAVCDHIATSGALGEVRAEAFHQVAEAKAALTGLELPDSRRRALNLVADGVVERHA